jgi:hypothetical protein
MLQWYLPIKFWIANMDRTETIVVMTIGVIVGTFCMRGLSAKLR